MATRQRIGRTVMTIAALAIALDVTASLQAQQEPRFDVASVKQSTRTDGVREFQILPSGRLVVAGMSLKDLVRRAYLASDAFQDENRITGGPSWVSTDIFDITANTEGDLGYDEAGRPMRLIAMLKNLLEERFSLRVRTAPREASVYALVVARNDRRLGAALHRFAVDCPVFTQGAPRPAPDPVRWCGLRVSSAGGVVHVLAQGVTMKDVATSFSGFRSVSRIVQDKTELNDRFDFEIAYSPAVAPSADAAVAGVQPSDSPGSFFTVIEEQLGLKLQPTRAVVDFYIIEGAEHPTAN